MHLTLRLSKESFERLQKLSAYFELENATVIRSLILKYLTKSEEEEL
jgi:predicted DNA-binding protein